MTSILAALTMMIAVVDGTTTTSGEIHFTEITYVKKFMNWDEMSPERAKRMKEFMPDSVTSDMMLLFEKDEMIYKPAKKVEQAEYGEHGGRGRHIKMMMGGGSNTETYQSISQDTMIQFKESMGKKFLIKDGRREWKWKMTGERKKVLGYSCMEARHIIAEDTTSDTKADTVSAWFTMQIPVSAGPGEYHGLPGMILEVERMGGKHVVLASYVGMREIKKAEIEEPTQGKVVTQEEYDEIMRKKAEEMREMYGGKKDGRHHYRIKKH